MRIILFAFSLLLSTNAFAFNTYRAGNAVISTEDPSMKVLDAMGDPRIKEPVFNKYGAQLGEYWYNKDGGKTVKFYISGGRIASIEEIR